MAAISRTFTVLPRSEIALDYLKDFSHAKEWDPGTGKCARNGSGLIGVGASWRIESQVGGKKIALTYTLTELAAELVVFVGENDIVGITKTISVNPAGDGSQIRYDFDLELYGVAESVWSDVQINLAKLVNDTEKQLRDALNALATRGFKPSERQDSQAEVFPAPSNTLILCTTGGRPFLRGWPGRGRD